MMLQFKYRTAVTALVAAFIALIITASAIIPASALENEEESLESLNLSFRPDMDDLEVVTTLLGVIASPFTMDTGTMKRAWDRFINSIFNDPVESPPPAGDDDAIKRYVRELDAIRSVEQQYNLLMVASDLVRNDTQTWRLTAAHLNRVAEISAAMYWDDGVVYDPNAILELAGVYNLISMGNLNSQDILDRAVKVSADLRAKWDTTNYGSGLDIELVWDGGGTGTSASRLYMDYLTLAVVSDNRNVIYLSQSTEEFALETNSTIWSYDGIGTLTSLSLGSDPVPLNAGANDVSNLESGFYVLSPGTYGGPFLSAVSADSAIVTGAVGLICDEKYGYAVHENDKVRIFWDGELEGVSSTLDFRITGEGVSQQYTSHGSPLSLTLAYGAYVDQLSVLLLEASIAGQTMWSITDTAKQSNIFLSPSSIIPHLSNMNITPQQSYAIYVMALDQIAAYNATYGDVLKDGLTRISAQSLELYCHGSVYDQYGNLVLENAVLTPYVYLDDMKIHTGKTTYTQDGLIMVWDAADTLNGWNMPVDTSLYEPMIMPKGAYLVLDEIVYAGKDVPSVNLEVVSIERIAAFDEIIFERSDTPPVLDASTLIMIIVIEIGIIIALIGYITRMPSLIAAGVIVALVGFFASDWIARFLLGRI